MKNAAHTTETMTRIALAACMMTVCAWITIPAAVPFTLQTFAVFLILILLGGRAGTAAIGLYLLLGCVGLPVFSGFRGGPGTLLGPTGGYLFGFLGSGTLYRMAEPYIRGRKGRRIAALGASLAVCYAVGSLWYYFTAARGTRSLPSILLVCVAPYVIPDLIKLFLAVRLGRRLKKALPEPAERNTFRE